MIAHGVTPILNVSNFAESIAWFERLGWKKLWDWGDPPSFGAVGSGKVEIFLCHDGQGGLIARRRHVRSPYYKGEWKPRQMTGTSRHYSLFTIHYPLFKSATPTATSSASAKASNARRNMATRRNKDLGGMPPPLESISDGGDHKRSRVKAQAQILQAPKRVLLKKIFLPSGDHCDESECIHNPTRRRNSANRGSDLSESRLGATLR